MTIRRLVVAASVGAVFWPGMSIGMPPVTSIDAMVCSSCHAMRSSGGGILAPRPAKDPVVWQVREFADELEILGFKGTVGAQESPRLQTLGGFPPAFAARGTGFRIFISLFEYRTPKFSFR
jgi:hypothetical protein